MNIIAVVVTYNRMELLKRNIRCLQQNKPISSIVIVNNGSTDGTTEWLAAQEGLTVINQTNVAVREDSIQAYIRLSGGCRLDLVHG